MLLSDGPEDSVPAPRSQPLRPTAHARIWLPFVCHLILHLACFSFEIVTLVLYCVAGLWKFFCPLLIVFLVNGVFCAYAAGKELSGKKPWWQIIFIYGLFQWIQVKHMDDAKERRAILNSNWAGVETPPPYNSKTFDGILPGMVFAIANKFAFYLMDSHAPRCPWYIAQALDDVCPNCSKSRWVFLVSAYLSTLSVALGAMEIDYRVSDTVRVRVDRSTKDAVFHYLYRAAEVTFRFSQINIFCIFLRNQAFMQFAWGAYALYVPIFVIWMIYYVSLATSLKESYLAHFFVAIAVIAVNPVRFVQIAEYVSDTRTLNQRVFRVRMLETVLFLFFLCYTFEEEFPSNCSIAAGSRPHVGSYTVTSTGGLAFVELFSSALIMFIAKVSTSYMRKSLSASEDLEAEMLNKASFRLQVQGPDGARTSAMFPKGLLSLLIQVGTGITSTIFHDRRDEQSFQDFKLEEKLGSGSYGVVLRVTNINDGREYAMKLLNTNRSGGSSVIRSRSILAERECSILEKLRALEHKFVIRLEWFFDVPSRTPFRLPDANDGDYATENVMDCKMNVYFHKALVMELCQQPLEKFLVENAIWIENGKSCGYQTRLYEDKFDFDMFLTMRRFSAEVLEAVRFLHWNRIIWRDMKPDNILLKQWADDDLQHICITDFGFAKDVSINPAESLAGNGTYLAPEINRIRMSGYTKPYTEAVDIYSLGKLIGVLLWREMYKWNGHVVPRLPKGFGRSEFSISDVRLPICAIELTTRMMRDIPEDRGSAEVLTQHAFFKAFLLRDCEDSTIIEHVPAIPDYVFDR